MERKFVDYSKRQQCRIVKNQINKIMESNQFENSVDNMTLNESNNSYITEIQQNLNSNDHNIDIFNECSIHNGYGNTEIQQNLIVIENNVHNINTPDLNLNANQLAVPNSVAPNNLKIELSNCLSKHNVSRECANDILQVLRNNLPGSNLPLDYRSLKVQTRINRESPSWHIDNMAKNGKFIYFGFHIAIERFITEFKNNIIEVDIGMV